MYIKETIMMDKHSGMKEFLQNYSLHRFYRFNNVENGEQIMKRKNNQ